MFHFLPYSDRGNKFEKIKKVLVLIVPSYDSKKMKCIHISFKIIYWFEINEYIPIIIVSLCQQ